MLTYDLTRHKFSTFPKLGFYYPVDISIDICSEMDAEYSSSKEQLRSLMEHGETITTYVLKHISQYRNCLNDIFIPLYLEWHFHTKTHVHF